jgi:hypothetical protein
MYLVECTLAKREIFNGEDCLQTIGQAGPEVLRSANALLASTAPEIGEGATNAGQKRGHLSAEEF